MSVKYAILGLLSRNPSHGYAIRTAFEEQLGDFWELNYGQVYQVLAALERDGLIVGANTQVGRRPTRKVFALSAKGRDALRSWLKTPPLATRPFRDDFYVRLLFAEEYGHPELRRILDDQFRACRERLARLVDNREPPTRSATGVPARQLFIAAAIYHAEADLKALELCRARLGEMSASPRAASEKAASADSNRPAQRAKRAVSR